jgi:hypothetical protein
MKFKVEQTDKPHVHEAAEAFEAEGHEHAAELWAEEYDKEDHALSRKSDDCEFVAVADEAGVVKRFKVRAYIRVTYQAEEIET